MTSKHCNLVIFEDNNFLNLLPLVYWRATFELRCGCSTLRQRICDIQCIDKPILYVRDELAPACTQEQLGQVQNRIDSPSKPTLFINGRALLFNPIDLETPNVVGINRGQIVYVYADAELASKLSDDICADHEKLSTVLAQTPTIDTDIKLMEYPWDMIHNNIVALEHDWKHWQHRGIAGKLYEGVHLLARDNIAIGPGCTIKPGTVLDAEDGPIIIAENVTIKPNCTLEGPLYIGENTLIQPGSSIGEGMSIGPVCKVGGELECSIIHSHSNKQHDGFLGHSYIGQWVNLAADTINSDLKNTYGSVRVPINGREVDTGHIFVGLTMGDHSKTSINSRFSTGTVIGFACNVFASTFSPRFLPSFSWLTDEGRLEAIPQKVLDIARTVMARRNIELTDTMAKLFLQIPALAQRYEHYDQAEQA